MTDARLSNLLGALVLSLHDNVREAIDSELDIQGEAAAALVTIGNNPGQSVEWLRHALGLTHSGTVRLLDRLEREDLIERRAAPSDARALQLYLKGQGRRRMEVIASARRRVIERALSALTHSQRRDLMGHVERMLAAVTVESRADAMCRLCDEKVCPQARCPITLACESR